MLLLYSHETNWKIQLRHVLLRYSSALRSKITFAGILTPNSSSSYSRQRMASPSISCPSSGIFWTLYGLQNDYATPLVPALCPMETITWVSASLLAFLKVRPVCSLQGGTGLWENEPALWDWSMASRFLSLPHFPQAAWRMLPCSGCTQSARGTPGGWWFPDHSKGCFVAPSEQSNTSLPCTAVLHTKSQTAGKKATSTKTSSFPFWMKKKAISG